MPAQSKSWRALDTCQCAAQIDVYAYHTYPGYGQNMNPETMDYGAYGPESPAKLRELVAKHAVQVFALGNGPGCRDTEEFLADLITTSLPELSSAVPPLPWLKL